MRLVFLGATGTVTGSRYAVETAEARVLVDCGLFQERALAGRNWEPFPVPPAGLDAVVLTHAHLDHVGRLPRLVREGFRGRALATAATADLARVVLLDSAHVQAEDAAFKKKRHAREGRAGAFPEEPLSTQADAEAAVRRLQPAPYGEAVAVAPGIEAVFIDAGHILGAAAVLLRVREGGRDLRLLFSGDVGRWGAPILRDPAPVPAADAVVVETTYGDRLHGPMAAIPDALARIVNDTVRAGGNVVIPAFAIERSQDLLYHLGGLLRAGRIPRLPVFLDSPMAVRVTELFARHPELFDAETLDLLRRGEHPCDFPGLTLCRTTDESKAIARASGSAIILAGSGMATGGRIKHHLAANVGRPESTILFVGYQARGTLGRLIQERAPEVRILGKPHAVTARVESLSGFSAHADRDELLRWLSGLPQPPGRVFLTHGEPEAARSFQQVLTAQTGWPVRVPDYGSAWDL